MNGNVLYHSVFERPLKKKDQGSRLKTFDPAEKYDGVTAYCVEQARWSKWGGEDHSKFVPAQVRINEAVTKNC